jgi:hypothetical protein
VPRRSGTRWIAIAQRAKQAYLSQTKRDVNLNSDRAVPWPRHNSAPRTDRGLSSPEYPIGMSASTHEDYAVLEHQLQEGCAVRPSTKTDVD